MNTRLPTLIAALSIAGSLGWLAYMAPERAQPEAVAAEPSTAALQERSAGSEVPCAVPLSWRVARVDPEFGLSTEEATEAVRQGASLWEAGTGRALFRHDPERGFPIRLVYDERQERLNERGRREQSLAALRADIESSRRAVESDEERYGRAAAAFATWAADLERRVSDYNAAVRAWNESDDQSEERWRALEAAGADLQQEQDELLAGRPPLDAQLAGLRSAEEELNERIYEHERLRDELETALPQSEVEAGVYREAVTRQDGVVISLSREIRLYRFSNGSELRLLAAHELGHALGLGHTDDPTGVMHASARSDQPVTALATSDADLLAMLCPADDTR